MSFSSWGEKDWVREFLLKNLANSSFCLLDFILLVSQPITRKVDEMVMLNSSLHLGTIPQIMFLLLNR
jgi:hypothetical protein